ncbi:MAG: 4Fe-4S dicluster domain-containing protein [Candidatus Omnitrophica bacterium]|nr:4Fe-4S dicluster domain-containing protein [Candidatus Omnitrophota bacterium]
MMEAKKITLEIDIERCKGCELCVNICPSGALKMSENLNKRGIRYVVLDQAEKCTGCGFCALVCPDCAITIREKE